MKERSLITYSFGSFSSVSVGIEMKQVNKTVHVKLKLINTIMKYHPLIYTVPYKPL